MIELKNIHKTYHAKNMSIQALKGIDLTIKDGSIFGIIGRSGAGKSTLIRMLNLLERPDAGGSVIVDGQDLTALTPKQLNHIRHHIGMVFQHFNLLHSKTILDNVCFPLKLAKVPKAQRIERARSLIAMVGLAGMERKYPGELSGGQQQRVGIARALAGHSKLLLCDEATSALDPETTQSILDLLATINRELNLTIVLITHSMDVIRNICDQVAVIESGKIVEQGDVLDVFLTPQHATTKSLLSECGADLHDWKGLVTNEVIVKLTYRGTTTLQPLLSMISRDLHVDISILQGTVGRIKDTPYGQLVASIDTHHTSLETVRQFFVSQQVTFELLQGTA